MLEFTEFALPTLLRIPLKLNISRDDALSHLHGRVTRHKIRESLNVVSFELGCYSVIQCMRKVIMFI